MTSLDAFQISAQMHSSFCTSQGNQNDDETIEDHWLADYGWGKADPARLESHKCRHVAAKWHKA